MVPETCSFPDCGRKLKAKTLKLCATHYSQHLGGQDLRPVLKHGPVCTFSGCGRTHYTNGLCGRHRKQERNGETLTPNPEPRATACQIAECERAPKARGWCAMHYVRWQKSGDPLLVKTIVGDDEARFWSKVSKAETCWEWIGGRDLDGYGSIAIGGVHRGAHRFSYELANGPIPEGLEVDHRCHNRACVNPAHLRLATHKQNMENRSGAHINSKSGVLGVSWNKRTRAWTAKVSHEGKQFHIGYYPSRAEAEAAVIAKRNELFTHNDRDRIAA